MNTGQLKQPENMLQMTGKCKLREDKGGVVM
jgi:hypothetical protein